MDAHGLPTPSGPTTPGTPSEPQRDANETLGWGPKITVILFLTIAGLFAAFSIADLIVGMFR